MCFQKCHCFASASLSGVKVKLNLEKSPHKSDYIQDIWIHPKQHQKRKKKILQKPESLDLQSCPVALKTNESPPVRKCQHFAGDLRQHTNLWDFSTLALISTELSELQKRVNRANQLVLFFLAGANCWENHTKNC